MYIIYVAEENGGYHSIPDMFCTAYFERHGSARSLLYVQKQLRMEETPACILSYCLNARRRRKVFDYLNLASPKWIYSWTHPNHQPRTLSAHHIQRRINNFLLPSRRPTRSIHQPIPSTDPSRGPIEDSPQYPPRRPREEELGSCTQATPGTKPQY